MRRSQERTATGAPLGPMKTQRERSGALDLVLRWFFESRRRTAARPPFYCDPTQVGSFAIAPGALAAGADAAIFHLFVTLSMYQALRDVIIMRQQRSLSRTSMRVVADVQNVERSILRHPCPRLRTLEDFEAGCDVVKHGDTIDCASSPGAPCHVKEATRVFNRMGDMGKLPTSAWLRVWKRGVRALLDEVCASESSPTARAVLLVERFTGVHRVGRKLATMFVSALSTPALAPGFTPWFPEIDGNELVVVDTNVAHAIDAMSRLTPKTYDARERWVREQSARIDLRAFDPKLPEYSPRLVQEALYAFCSKSNRVGRRDACAGRSAACTGCAPTLCPFAQGSLRP